MFVPASHTCSNGFARKLNGRPLFRLSEYLSEFERNEAVHESEVALQPLFSEPKKAVHKYAAGGDASQAKHMVAVNWLLAGQAAHSGFTQHVLIAFSHPSRSTMA